MKYSNTSFQKVGAALRTPTARLAASYLLIIMLMSIGFSLIFYNTSSHELGRQLPSPDIFDLWGLDDINPRRDSAVNDFFAQRIAEGRESLQTRLFLLNLAALIVGSMLSYLLARKTLQPIEANMEAQTQFVGDASHELRTPLTALRTTNEVALRRDSLSKKDVKNLLENNIQEVVKLQTLTDSLLRLARQDAAGGEMSSVSLQDIVSDAMNIVMKNAVDKNIAIEDTVPAVHVMANQPNLTQVLAILLDNAIKYSSPDSEIRLTGGQRGKYGFISVHDEGCGISADEQPYIFDRFYRADQSRNKEQADGFGIGLALASKIVKQHHGEITVASESDKGSVFTISLPLK